MAEPQQCLGGCGFFGNPGTMNMCSKCYRDYQGFGEVKKCLYEVFHVVDRLAAPVGEGKKSSLKTELKTDSGVTIQVRHGDMTEETVDCIVNAANSSLDHASGLAGAIIKKGGQVIQNESDVYISKNGRLEEGGVAVTGAGKLPCKYIIHAVGPTWRGGHQGEEILLGMTVRSCLEKADELKATSISLPAISSGIFGFPKEKCATILFEMTLAYLKENQGKTTLTNVNFTNFDDRTVDLFEKECTRIASSKQ